VSKPPTTEPDDLAARFAALEKQNLLLERENAALAERIRWFEEQQRLALL
jgi:hypothetical protein